MHTILYLISGFLFLVSLTAHIYVRLRLRPKPGSDLDDYYHEFEDQYPAYVRYLKWSRITFTGIVISMLLLFIAVAI